MVKVLVVEDEASIREMIALNLRLAGMEAVEADSAEAALLDTGAALDAGGHQVHNAAGIHGAAIVQDRDVTGIGIDGVDEELSGTHMHSLGIGQSDFCGYHNNYLQTIFRYLNLWIRTFSFSADRAAAYRPHCLRQAQ